MAAKYAAAIKQKIPNDSRLGFTIGKDTISIV